jgi:ATP-dependent helicase/nuclease subunit B
VFQLILRVLENIVQQHKSEMKLYQSQADYYGFSEKLSEQIQDFKKYSLSSKNKSS